nr:unnamed protein product [Digitaria exilis]
MAAAAISAVLGDDDLLREILLRLGFATTLVRAAAVSRRWLRIASNLAFLRRFRARHPPPLLGFYYHDYGDGARTSSPSRRPPSSPAPSASPPPPSTPPDSSSRTPVTAACSSYKGHNHAVLDPLHPTRDAATLPHPEDLYFWAFLAGGVVSACVFFPWGKAMVKVARTLRAMQRVVFQHTVIDVPRTAAVVGVVHAPVQGKIYIATNCGDMLERGV